MADFSALKQSIETYIKNNGNKEITGAILQNILLSMVTTMGDGAINDNASDITDIKGDIRNINGDITNINGNITDINGAITNINGDITDLNGDLTDEVNRAKGAETTTILFSDGKLVFKNAAGTVLYQLSVDSFISAITTRLNTGALYAGYATPSTTPATLTSQEVFYLATQAGTYTNFHFNGGDDPIVLTKDGIYFIVSGNDDDDWNAEPMLQLDDVPTASSNNAVKSGGVAEEFALGAVYDVSAKNPTAGPNNDGKWESLSALFSDANLSTLIPISVRKGGMSIKFVSSIDNKYVQYRLMADSFNTTVANWQGVDDEPTAGSDNLVKSGGVANYASNRLFANLTVPAWKNTIKNFYIDRQYVDVDNINILCLMSVTDTGRCVIGAYYDNTELWWADCYPSANEIVYEIKVYLARPASSVAVDTVVGYIEFEDYETFLQNQYTQTDCYLSIPYITDTVRKYFLNLADSIKNGGIEEIKLDDKLKLYKTTSPQYYVGKVAEAYIKKLPAGNVVLKAYEGACYMYETSSGVYAKCLPTENNKVYPVIVYMTADNTNYPVGTIIGYVVFSDYAGFLSYSTGGEATLINREFAENLSHSPRIIDYIKNEVVVSLPSIIDAVVGDTLQLYYKSIFRCPDPYIYDIKVSCDVGSQFPRYYELTPQASDIGEHTITFIIKDSNNIVLGAKSAVLNVISKGISPVNNINVLCLGASGTEWGQWAGELKRRLTGTGGTPAGDGKTNITFVGRREVNNVKVEATGGYSFPRYTDDSVFSHRFNIGAEHPITSVSKGDVYSYNGNSYVVTEINLVNGVGNISCSGQINVWSSSEGTLTRVSGAGDETIIFESCYSTGNPFVNPNTGLIDMQYYADLYCNGKIDIIITELFGNGTIPYNDVEYLNIRMSQMMTFINQVRATFPNCKFCIGLFWNPDEKGGAGENEHTGDWADYYAIKYSNHSLCNYLSDFINNNGLQGYVYIVNWLNEFDADYDYQYGTKKANVRSDIDVIWGLNEVHPSIVGYNQMADSAYRCFIAKFCQ